MREKVAEDGDRGRLSRREFSRILAAGAALSSLPATGTAGSEIGGPGDLSRQSEASQPSVEAEAQYGVLISRYGARLSDEQKADVRRLINEALKSTVTLRSFQLDNTDEPANVFQARLRT